LPVYDVGFAAIPSGPALPIGMSGMAKYQQVGAWLDIDSFVITQSNVHQLDDSKLFAARNTAGASDWGLAVIAGDTTDAEMAALSAAGVVGAWIMDLFRANSFKTDSF
jgi:D-galactarolactone isomerase